MDNNFLEKIFHESIRDHELTFSYLKTNDFYEKFTSSLKMLSKTIKEGGCIFTCGNGGSFADAQHFTAELVVRYKRTRDPIKSITLGSNFSNISACSNDFTFENVFQREYQGLSSNKDSLVAISTSGNSENIKKIINYAENLKRNWILLTSDKISEIPNGGIVIPFPFTSTAAIQECHIFTLHILCRALDDLIYGSKKINNI